MHFEFTEIESSSPTFEAVDTAPVASTAEAAINAATHPALRTTQLTSGRNI